jgi:hypothetical protein
MTFVIASNAKQPRHGNRIATRLTAAMTKTKERTGKEVLNAYYITRFLRKIEERTDKGVSK